MAQIFEGYPEAIDNTLVIAERCAFRLERLTGQFPLFPVPEGFTRQSYLRDLVYRGAFERYGSPLDSTVERQLEYELGMIAKADLAGYFLIVWDIVRAGNELGVLCQGRGSAANSAVCYSLGITAVDPIGMNLLFERFMSEGRKEIPDIDVDFAHQDREKVIQYVYDRYGRTHAAMAAEVVTYHTRSAIRDVGKALGLTLAQVDAVAREYDARESLAGATEVKLEGPLGERLVALCRRIDGFPRHMGIHSGGMVITRDPLVRVAPVEWATMRDRTIVQWDKDDLQDLGLIKIDLLGLGMLSLLREAFALHERVTGERLKLHTIPADDPEDVRDDAARRYDRRFPNRVARAAVDAAAHETGVFLRYRDAGCDHPARTDPRSDDPSVFTPPFGTGDRELSAPQTQAGARAHAGRAALPRAGHAHGG